MILLTLDFETYYDDEFSLRKMATSSYIRDERFVVMGAGVKVNDEPTKWLESEEIAPFLDSLKGKKVALIGHNLPFDGLILSLRYNFVPELYLDTLGMARAVLGDAPQGHGLDAVAEYLGVGNKIANTLGNMKGRGLETRTEDPELWEDYCRYGIRDVDLTRDVFNILIRDFPKQEQKAQDITIRMGAQPMLELDGDLCHELLIEEEELHRTAYDRFCEAMVERGFAKPTKTDINSNARFAVLLEGLGVEVPMKKSTAASKEGQMTYAFAKDDEDFVALQLHDDELVRQAYDTRMRMKSRINITRVERFAKLSQEGPLCVPLNYAGATRTGRWSGGSGLNLQNLPRSGRLRNTICAPEGHKLVVCDLSSIELRVLLAEAGEWDALEDIKSGTDMYLKLAQTIFGPHVTNKTDFPEERQGGKVGILSCLAANTKVVTHNGIKEIVDVGIADKVWDGVEWVSHGGVVYQGEKQTLCLNKIRMTPDHKVLSQDGQLVSALQVAQGNTPYQSLGMYMENSQLPTCPLALEGGSPMSSLFAPVGITPTLTWITSIWAELQGAIRVLSRRLSERTGLSMGRLCPMKATGAASLSGSLLRSHGVITSTISYSKIMADEGYLCVKSGERTEVNSWSMFKRLTAGISRSWTLTASTITRAISPVTYGLLLAEKTHLTDEPSQSFRTQSTTKTPSLNASESVYDLLNCGKRRRFTVVNPDGEMMVVSNCGYGLGSTANLIKFGRGMGVNIEDPMARQIIDGYRRGFPKVVRYWKTMGEAVDFIGSLQREGNGTRYRFPGLPNFLEVSRMGIHLPSGLAVKYPDLRSNPVTLQDGSFERWSSGEIKQRLTCMENKRGVKNGRSAGIWGGAVTGHVTQALARCIIAEQMVEIAKRWKAVLTVHDEVVLCVPEEQAQEAYDDLHKVMTTPLPWWPELPLDAEGVILDFYQK